MHGLLANGCDVFFNIWGLEVTERNWTVKKDVNWLGNMFKHGT